MKEPRQIVIFGESAYVPLTKGHLAIIDSADVNLIVSYHWHAKEKFFSDGRLKCVYAVSRYRNKSTYLHRIILDCQDGLLVDHIDGDGLNNKRSNLRIATHSENSRNQRYRTDNKSGVKGVAFHKDTGKWQAFIRVGNKQRHLGLFANKENAAIARASASSMHYGEFKRD